MKAYNYLQPSGLNHSSLIVDDFNDDEIQNLCEKLAPLKTMVDNPSLKVLLKNPFLADLAYRIAATGTQFSGSDGEKEFRVAVWRDVIAKEHVRVNGLPLKRRQVFVDIAVLRAKQMAYGVSGAGFDAETLLVLEEDGLIRRDTTNELVSPAHDVLEDWALERYIDDAYRQSSGDVVKFLDAVGNEPAMNRAFRLWLHQKLKDGDNVNDLIIAILNNQEIQRHWQDEAISAILLGQKPYDFLKALREHLFENEGHLLKRFCFILRIACQTPNQDLIKRLSGNNGKPSSSVDTLFLKPYGQGWDAILRLLFENKESISSSLVPHLTAVLYEWSSSIHVEKELPASTREAGLLALHILDGLKNSYRDGGNRKKILGVIVKTVPAIQGEFHELLNADVFNTGDEQRRPSYVKDLCKIALEEFSTIFLCKHVPDIVTKIAFHEWLVTEPQSNDKPRQRSLDLGVDGYFGLHSYRTEFFPASGAKGPFQFLLRFHPRKGLDFIIQLLNQSAEKYAHSGLDHSIYPSYAETRSAAQLEISLDDRTTIKQYYSSRIWSAYRGHSVVPYILQSALMALENWLINLAEYSESQENLEWVFDYILRNSNSVMPTAVLASLATGFPAKLGKLAFPLLLTPELYELDMTRSLHERSVGALNWFADTYDPFADMYAEERRIAALRQWRQEHLESLICWLQFSELREEALAVIDKLRVKTPEDKNWRFRFHRIDSRGWTPVEDKENNRIMFQSRNMESDLVEIQQKSQEEVSIMNRFSELLLWAGSTLKKEPPSKEYYPNWEVALTEAKHLFDLLGGDLTSNLSQMFYPGIVKAAAVFLRDHSSEMVECDMLWCSELVISVVTSTADSGDLTVKADNADFRGEAASASVLPILLKYAEVEERNDIKKVIAIALTHTNANVRAGVANGIREHLQLIDPEFAQKCILGTIEYARLETEYFSQRRYSYSLDDEEEAENEKKIAWIDSIREQLTGGTLLPEAGCIGNLNFVSHSAWHLVNACLMIPSNATDPIYAELMSRMIVLFFRAEESINKPRSERDSERDIQIHYERRLPFTNRFARYLLALPEKDANVFLEQLLKGCDSAPEFIYHLLQNIAYFTERTPEKVRYWDFWKKFSPEGQALALKLAGHDQEDRRNDNRTKLIRGMLFADYQWEKANLEYESEQLKNGKEWILDFSKGAGKNPDVFEAVATIMNYFPAIFFNPGIHILAKHQIETGGTNLFSGVNTAFYLVSAIQRFLQIDETGPLSKEMHQSCLVLLDAIVETASSSAYYLREQLIRSRRIL